MRQQEYTEDSSQFLEASMRRFGIYSLTVAALLIGSAFGQDAPEKTADQVGKEKKDTKIKKGSKKDVEAIGERDAGKGVNFYSIEKEIAMGKGYAQEIERQAKIVDDPVISEYVNRVGQNLVRNSDTKVPVTIKVVDSEEVNAFALPGGFFFVNSGLILKAESESELAGVMAHEIAHIAARHGTRQATRGQIANMATIPLIFMGRVWHPAGGERGDSDGLHAVLARL
jgi:predicted Zn-dependent protease